MSLVALYQFEFLASGNPLCGDDFTPAEILIGCDDGLQPPLLLDVAGPALCDYDDENPDWLKCRKVG